MGWQRNERLQIRSRLGGGLVFICTYLIYIYIYSLILLSTHMSSLLDGLHCPEQTPCTPCRIPPVRSPSKYRHGGLVPWSTHLVTPSSPRNGLHYNFPVGCATWDATIRMHPAGISFGDAGLDRVLFFFASPVIFSLSARMPCLSSGPRSGWGWSDEWCQEIDENGMSCGGYYLRYIQVQDKESGGCILGARQDGKQFIRSC